VVVLLLDLGLDVVAMGEEPFLDQVEILVTWVLLEVDVAEALVESVVAVARLEDVLRVLTPQRRRLLIWVLLLPNEEVLF